MFHVGQCYWLMHGPYVHRDPNIWDDATSFKPERFESGESDVNKLMPFGLGRKAYPGAGLAQRIIGLTLGSQ